MEIQVRTDRQLPGAQELATFIGYELIAGLGASAARVASALVELTEEGNGAPRLRCLLEVWPAGHAPVVVSRLSATGEEAVRGAVEDMRRLLERMFRRLDGRTRPD